MLRPRRRPDPARSTSTTPAGAWIAGGQYVYSHTDPVGTGSQFDHTKYVRDPSDRPAILSTGGDGGFSWLANGGVSGFVQYQGTTAADYTDALLWVDVWTYLADHVLVGDATAIRYRDVARFLGGFNSVQAALDELNLQIVTAEFAADTYFFGVNTDGIYQVDTFVGGVVTRSDNFHWRGPLTITDDIANYITDHLYSDATPRPAAAVPSAGTDDEFSRADHVHPAAGGAANDRRLFRAAWTDKTLAISSTALVYAEAMQIADTAVERDIGGFAVETLLSISRVEIPVAGVYLCKLHVAVAGADNRTRCAARFVISTGGVDRAGAFPRRDLCPRPVPRAGRRDTGLVH